MLMSSRTSRRGWALALATAWALAACGGGNDGVAVPATSTTERALAAPAATARNLPAGNKIRFIVGQNTPDISAFRNTVLQDSGFLKPTGVTLYTHLSTGCNGLSGRCDLGFSGNVMDFNATLAENPGASLAVGLFLADGGANQPVRALLGRALSEQLAVQAGFPGAQTDLTDDVVNGYRSRLDTLITYLRDTGRPVFLRFGYEFDGPWNRYSRVHFKEAFRFAKGRVNALGANNVAMVWQSATYPTDGDPAFAQDFGNPNHLADWYPGDDVVDWVAMSAFFFDGSFRTRQYTCRGVGSPGVSNNPNTLYNNMVNFAKSRAKPVMIAESSPTGYHLQNSTGSCVVENNPVAVSAAEMQLWYQNFFDFILANKDQIRAVSYINSNWEAIKQFNCQGAAGSPSCTDGYWGNSALQANTTIKNYVKTRLADACFEGNAASCGADGGGGTTVPSAPGNLGATQASTSSIALSWADNANNETGFLIQRSEGTGAFADLATVGANVTGYTNTGLAAGTRYQYRVAARNSAGTSSYSNVADLTLSSGTTIPASPGGLSATQTSSTSIAIGWADSANNETGFVLQRLVGTGAWADLTTLGANVTSYSDTGLTAGTRYQYRVAARNSAGTSGYSNVGDVTLPGGGGDGGGGGGGGSTLPGAVTSASFTGSATFNVTVSTTGAYYFVISYSSSANSKLVSTTFNGSTAYAAVDTGTGSVRTIDFNGVGTGSATVTVNAESGVTVTRVEAFKR